MKIFFIALSGALIGALSVVGLTMTGILSEKTNPYLEYYTVENAVAVSPHDLRMEMDKWLQDTIIVDLRTRGEYQKEHIKWAINIPGIDGDANAEAQEARIVAEFKKLPQDKRIIVHCYTHYCMLAKHVGLMLAKQWIQVHELNIGWNEWRNEWDLWNGEGTSAGIDISRYIEGDVVTPASTTDSGTIDFRPCTADGLAGC